MGDTLELIVDPAYSGLRLDAWLAQTMPEYTRGAWQKHIKADFVLKNHKALKPSYVLKGNEVVQIVGTPEVVSIQQIASKDALSIIYEDDDVIVIDKPAGLITHPKPGSSEPSVSGSLIERIEDKDLMRPGIVHRLDKDTSGVMIVAKHAEAKRTLQAAFKSRAVQKEYLALVWGDIGVGVQRIHFSLSRATRNATQMEVDPLGKQSETYIQGIAHGDGVTLVSAKPTTGRTHQIRVHLAAIKHPIVGDPVYGDRPPGGKRLMLHAHALTLPLPNGTKQTFTSLPPEDFMQVLRDFSCTYQVQ